LAHARMQMIDADYDVFGHGIVILKYAPGHTGLPRSYLPTKYSTWNLRSFLRLCFGTYYRLQGRVDQFSLDIDSRSQRLVHRTKVCDLQ